MRRLLLLVLSAGVVAVGFGCTGDDDDDDDGGTDVTVTGTISGDDGAGGSLLVGATVEEVGTNNDVTTTSGGAFSIDVPSGTPVFLRASYTGYHSSQRGIIAPAGGLTNVSMGMPADALVAAVGGILGVTIDPAKGIVAVNAEGASVGTSGGFTATLSAASTDSFVFNSNGDPVAGGTTLPNGDSTIIFLNVDAGTTTVTLTPPGAVTCSPEYAITNQRVDGDVITDVAYDCP